MMLNIKNIEKIIKPKIKKGMTLAIGTSKNAYLLIKELAYHNVLNDLNIKLVPTSLQIAELAHKYHIELTNIKRDIDLVIEFADYVDPLFNYSKLESCSFIRDQIIASFSKETIVFVKSENIKPKIPKIAVEITNFAKDEILNELNVFGKAKLLNKKTINNNLVAEIELNDANALDTLDYALKKIPGVLETGLFIGKADIIYEVKDKVKTYIDLTKTQITGR